MEVDITKKAKYVLRYGLIGLLMVAIICAGAVWFYQNHHNYITVNDGKVMSSMVGAKAQAPGTITEMVVADGDQVEAGDVIAHIKVNVTEEQLQQLQQTVQLSQQNLDQLKKGTTVTQQTASAPVPVYHAPSSGGNSAEAARARSRLERMNELYSMGAISAVKRDQAEADYNAAVSSSTAAPSSEPSAPAASFHTVTQPAAPEVIKQAELQLKQAQAALENAQQDSQATDILAPVAGTVYMSDVQEGNDVRAGQTIVNIGDASNLWLEAHVDRAQKSKLRLGAFAAYTIDNHKFQGTILDIVDPQDEDNAVDQNGDVADDDQSALPADTGDGNDQTNDQTNGMSTEGKAPVTDPDRLTVRISLPTNTDFAFKPGTSAIIKLSI